MYFKQHFRIAVVLGVTLLGAVVGQTARAGQEPTIPEAGEYTKQMENTEIGYFELMSNHPFTAEERRDILANSNAAFHRKPHVFMRNIQSNAKFLRDYAAFSPVNKQGWRYELLKGLFIPQTSDWISTPTEIADYQRIIRHYVQPLIGHMPEVLHQPTPVLVLPEDMQAAWEATQFSAKMLDVSAPSREQFHALVAQVCTTNLALASPAAEFLRRLCDFDYTWLAFKANNVSGSLEVNNIPAAARQDPTQLALAVPEAYKFCLPMYHIEHDADGKLSSPAAVKIKYDGEMTRMRMVYAFAGQMSHDFGEQLRQEHVDDAARRRQEDAAAEKRRNGQ